VQQHTQDETGTGVTTTWGIRWQQNVEGECWGILHTLKNSAMNQIYKF